MPSLPLPPLDLAGFPEHVLAPGHPLFRIHRRGRSPWWFGSSGRCRFDLARPRGTCYLAGHPLGAFIEVFRDTHLVDQRDVDRRRLSRVALLRRLRLADCTAGRGRSFGVTGAIHSTPDYERTHAWAAGFESAGFDGVRYKLSQDPAQELTGYALFGDAGEPVDPERWPAGSSERIDGAVLREARDHFGVLVLPAG